MFSLTLCFFVFKSKVSDEEYNEHCWEKQEAMVRRLQKEFPDQDKEVRTHIFQVFIPSRQLKKTKAHLFNLSKIYENYIKCPKSSFSCFCMFVAGTANGTARTRLEC